MADQASSASTQWTSTSQQLMVSLDKQIQSSTTNYEALKRYRESSIISLIYRIPAEIRELNERAYIPSVVSIGPFHRDVEHLQAMEADKLSYMQYLFSRSEDPRKYKKVREDCVNAMLQMESNARTWYGELHIRADNEEAAKVKFAEMMFIDGCFIIELLYRNYQRITYYTSIIADPILDNHSMKSAVQHDLIRLENQIPFPVLDKLFSLTVGTFPQTDPQYSIKKCVFLFFKGVMGLESMPDWEHPLPFHILDYFHFFYRPSDTDFHVNNEEPSGDSFRVNNAQFRYSATQLDFAGVKFRPGSTTNLFDVNFSPKPPWYQMFRSRHFQIPLFRIDSSTETFLRNLITMEQFYEDRYHYFTSHAFLMDKLIDTAKDVDLLVEAGVIQNYLGSSEEAACLYNNICKNVYVGGFHFTEPCNQVTEHCKSFVPRHLAILKRDYFGNPWTILSVFVAFSIFVLTLLQTIYAMK